MVKMYQLPHYNPYTANRHVMSHSFDKAIMSVKFFIRIIYFQFTKGYMIPWGYCYVFGSCTREKTHKLYAELENTLLDMNNRNQDIDFGKK